ncbi:MAG: Rieske (2Fe-2S) protein [Calditrichaeota bacterium]|nr:Rieske (2Fe-2S) protein [Calditrichota bacterium]
MITNKMPGRRKFMGWSFFTSLTGFFGMIFYPIWRFIMPPPVAESTQNSVKAAVVNELQPNSGKIFPFNNKPAILIRLSNGKYRSFTAVCTHLQCTVQYRKDWKIIWCACHNGKYDLNGLVISGPPPRPLEEYDVLIVKKDIIVTRRKA